MINYNARFAPMTLPFAIPDWMPWWVPILVLVPAILYALVFLFMPFSVLGTKGRLDSIEARLDELHAELRGLAFRLPEPPHGDAYDDPPPLLRARPAPERTIVPARPPIPPAPSYVDEDVMEAPPPPRPPRLIPRRDAPGFGPARPARAEPRLDGRR